MHFAPEKIFSAFSEPEHLQKWWGPSGFRNTFTVFEFSEGGNWEFIMHGPDGTDYKNQSIFREIKSPSKIVIEHVVSPHFFLTVTLTPEGELTRIGWSMLFDTADIRDSVAKYAVDANEQNFDRLEQELTLIN